MPAPAYQRDAGWVNAWMDSGLPFHIIRDYFSHCELMLAGLFGVRGGVLANIENMIRQWLSGNGAFSLLVCLRQLCGT